MQGCAPLRQDCQSPKGNRKCSLTRRWEEREREKGEDDMSIIIEIICLALLPIFALQKSGDAIEREREGGYTNFVNVEERIGDYDH